MDLAAAVSGLLFGFSLIVAIGAQNVFVLRQAILREHAGLVVAICTVSDAALIAAGIQGVGSAAQASPALLSAVRVAGVALLLGYGALAARRAVTGRSAVVAAAGPGGSRRRVAATTLVFTWLNPAVYLDTLVLLGTVANAHRATRWWFGAGAATASALWFAGLSGAAGRLGPVLRRPGVQRALDGFIALTMASIAIRTVSG